MRLFLSILVLFVASAAFAQVEPIPEYNIPYYQKAFSKAKFQSRGEIADPITTGSPNDFYFRLFDEGLNLLGYVRDVATTTGCNSLCKPLDFTLTFNKSGIFHQVLVREPLTKINDLEFTEEDYSKMHGILTEPPSVYSRAKEPMDLVDAVTKATVDPYKAKVVKGAALTSFRTHQYKMQSIDGIRPDAPAFVLKNLQGKEIAFDPQNCSNEYSGKVTVLEFFSSWCPYCKKELPYMEKVYQKYKGHDGVRFLSVRTFIRREYEDIHKFVKRLGLTFPIVSDTTIENPPENLVSKKFYSLKYVPTTFLVDRDGRLKKLPATETPEEFQKNLETEIEKSLNE